MMGAATAIIFVAPAMIVPIRIAQIERAGVGQTADSATGERANRGTRGRCTCGQADNSARACADGRAGNGAFPRIGAAA